MSKTILKVISGQVGPYEIGATFCPEDHGTDTYALLRAGLVEVVKDAEEVSGGSDTLSSRESDDIRAKLVEGLKALGIEPIEGNPEDFALRVLADASAHIKDITASLKDLGVENSELTEINEGQTKQIADLAAKVSDLEEQLADQPGTDDDGDGAVDDLENMTVADLKSLAEQRGVGVGSRTRKELLAALRTPAQS